MEPKIYGFYNINVELTTIYFWFHERDHEITRPCSTDYKPSQGQKVRSNCATLIPIYFCIHERFTRWLLHRPVQVNQCAMVSLHVGILQCG